MYRYSARSPKTCNHRHDFKRLSIMTTLTTANHEASKMERALLITAEVLAYAFVLCVIFMALIENF